MPFLIDGHNLIPKLGLRLDSLDDEMELVSILQEYSRIERKKQVEVYFDGAPANQGGMRRLGTVTAHFITIGNTADDAIRKRLKRMGKSAKNWTVVSSDRQVQTEARAAQAEIITSDLFARQLKRAQDNAPKPSENKALSKREVDEWLKLFKAGKSK